MGGAPAIQVCFMASSYGAAGLRRLAPRTTSLRLEPLEDRRLLAASRIAMVVSGLGGEDTPPAVIAELTRLGFKSIRGDDDFESEWNELNPTNTTNPGSTSGQSLTVAKYDLTIGDVDITLPGGIDLPTVPGYSVENIPIGFELSLVDPGDPDNSDAMVAEAVARLNQYSDEDVIVLIGHSLGGDTVLRIAENVDVEIDVLALLDPVGFVAVPDLEPGALLDTTLGPPINIGIDVGDAGAFGYSIPVIPGIPFAIKIPVNSRQEVPGFFKPSLGLPGTDSTLTDDPVPDNVRVLVNRWQSNALFPLDFVNNNRSLEFNSAATDGSRQSAENEKPSDESYFPGRDGSGDDATASSLAILAPQRLERNPFDTTSFTIPNPDILNPTISVDIPTSINEDFLKSRAQLHHDFPQNQAVQNQLIDVIQNALTDVEPDYLEDNNTIDTATFLGSLSAVTWGDLTIHEDVDVDFFAITAHETGKLLVTAPVTGFNGSLRIEVLKASGTTLMNATEIEAPGLSGAVAQLAIPVVSQERYLLRISGVPSGDAEVQLCYDLEIETFPAPVPDAVILNPRDDSGLSNLDALTFVPNPEVFIQADLFHFADIDNSNTIAGAYEQQLLESASVQVFVNGLPSGFATAVANTNNTLFRYSIPTTALNAGIPYQGGLLNFVTAAVRISEARSNPTSGRTQLSPPLRLIHGDVQGPRITGVTINDDDTYGVFDPKPSFGPTPSAFYLTIRVSDGPPRLLNFLHNALDASVASNPAHYQLVGDSSGVVSIAAVSVVNDPTFAGLPANATIRLFFNRPLRDDRYTLTVSDAITDPAGNGLDGESDATAPGAPSFTFSGSGDGSAGGSFVARFNVDSEAEIGAWSSGSIYLDTNGNGVFDPQNTDAANRDIVHTLGFATDAIFAGDFALPDDGGGLVVNGFDKLAAYGLVSSRYRWLIDLTDDGVPDRVFYEAPGFAGAGTPIAGDFDGDASNGEEIGWFNGSQWRFDVNRTFTISDQAAKESTIFGLPFVGDFDGNGADDIGAYNQSTNLFSVLLNPSFAPGVPLGGTLRTFQFADGYPFVGVRDRPVAADFDADGYDDIGVWVPDRTGVPPSEGAEWYLLVSSSTPIVAPVEGNDRIVRDLTTDAPVVQFTPSPFGYDRFFQFGDEFAVPLVGNFDPPIGGEPSVNPQPQTIGDFGNDGVVGLEDRDVWVGSYGAAVFPGTGADGNGDGIVDAADYTIYRDALDSANSVSSAATTTGEAAASLSESISPEQSVAAMTPTKDAAFADWQQPTVAADGSFLRSERHEYRAQPRISQQRSSMSPTPLLRTLLLTSSESSQCEPGWVDQSVGGVESIQRRIRDQDSDMDLALLEFLGRVAPRRYSLGSRS